jgi:hypothetical protein
MRRWYPAKIALGRALARESGMNKYLLVLSLLLPAAYADAGMLINNDGLTYFGDIDRSGGTGGNQGRIFDEEVGTSAHRESTTGYVGVSFISPTVIDSVEFVSQVNGFDASGGSSTITLQAYCKTTAGAPANANDGTLIGSMSFTDIEAVTTKIITSSTPSLQCRYVWGKLTTGVWSALTELRIYSATSPEVSETDTPTVFRKSCNERAKLNYSAAELSCFRQAFQLNETRAVLVDLHSGFIHTGTSSYGTASYVDIVGLGVHAVRRSATTQADLPATSWQYDGNMVATGNIYDRNQHYIHLPITGCWELSPGFHEISVAASNHTDALPLNDFAQLGIVTVLAEGGSQPFIGRNLMLVQVLPAGSTCSGG